MNPDGLSNSQLYALVQNDKLDIAIRDIANAG